MENLTLELGLDKKTSVSGTSSPDYFKSKYGSNGKLNKLFAEDFPIHNWYRFVLSYPPHLVRDYIDGFNLDVRSTLLDPFCGTGTTLVESKKQGINAIGIEPHPMAHFASCVKTDWTIDPKSLLNDAEKIALEAEKRITSSDLRTITDEEEKLLLKNSISPLPLHKTLVLLECIKENDNKAYEKYELLALAKAVVFSISNLHFGPEVGVKGSKSDAEVVFFWLSEVRTMVKDLLLYRDNSVQVKALKADARNMKGLIEKNSIDAVITSPPYPNEKDYTRTTRLESVLLGLIKNRQDLRALKQDLIRSNTRNVYVADQDDKWVENHAEIQRIAREIEERRIELGKTSGFEKMYHRVTKLYFGGMAKHFADLSELLKPGAMLAYVVGDQASYLQVMIRTGELLADIAQSQGYELVNINLFRTRLATATKEQLREEVVVLRWPGK